jgi:hypothetical protein
LSVPQYIIIEQRCSFVFKIEGIRKINYGNRIAASRTDRITAGNDFIGGSNVKYGMRPNTQLFIGVALVSINIKELKK